MYLDWKVHEGDHALLRYSQPHDDGIAFFVGESESHADTKFSRDDERRWQSCALEFGCNN